MSAVKRMFSEFQSIFFTENVLKENERHANVVTATTMLNLFFVILISWCLSHTHIAREDTINMSYVVINSFIGLLIPSIICLALKGDRIWIKYMLFWMFIFVLGTIDSHLSYTMTFLMVIPVILSARYYKKYFTILVSVVTFAVFVIFAFINGINYIVNYQEIMSALLLYYVVVFAAVQISQSGKKMIEKQKEITEKGTRIETELNLANSIQKHMLPSIFPPFPDHEEIDIYASMTPAREVGGDFYDMFLLHDKYLVITVADVSGKGIPAALFMMISKILMKNLIGIEKKVEVDEVLNKVNKMLCEGNEKDIFITSWLGILNLETGKLEFANAGHNPPLIYSSKLGKYEYLRTDPNMVMACMDNVSYEKHEMYIEPNDKIFLYTDGVVEANNSRNELYGEERLKSFLNDHLEFTAKEVIEGLKKDLSRFSEGVSQFDDVTMLELNYKGKKKQKLEKVFDADVRKLPLVQEFILDGLKDHEFSKKSINEIILVSEEIFVNIAKYAYQDGKGDCKINILFDENNSFVCTFEDSGVPFNPLEEKEPDLSVSSKERKVGGLGVYLSKHIMDNIEYEYKNNKNILTIVKKVK